MTRRIRILTYNVHSCRGSDGRLDPERISRVIDAAQPDIAGLQELDADQERSRGVDQTRFLAERLGMSFFYVSARRCGSGHFGNALLCRLPCKSIRYACIPQLHETSEPRAAQWIAVDAPWGRLHVVNTHLGLRRQEQLIQARSLLSIEWLGHPEMGRHVVLCGDFNARPGSPAYSVLGQRLSDAQTLLRQRARPTFPALWPLVRIDHVFVTPSLGVERIDVPAGMARLASDHRPLVVDVSPISGETS